MRTLLLWMAACGSGLGDSDEVECIDHGECEEGELCLTGSCARVECVSSDVCALESYCSADTHVCVEGCEVEEDCLGGDTCDSAANQCVTPFCSDTEVDCDVGLLCNTDVGECQSVGDMCGECRTSTDCATAREECFLVDYDGNAFCFPSCNEEADCPAGFDCLTVTGGQSFCIGECAWFVSEGLL